MPLSQDFYNIATPSSSRTSGYSNPYSGSYTPPGAFTFQQPQEVDPGGVLDFVGSTVWGALSAVTFGLTEYVSPYAVPWEEKSAAAKSGMIIGEGLGLFLPWGPFGLMGKGARAVTKMGANKFVGKAEFQGRQASL